MMKETADELAAILAQRKKANGEGSMPPSLLKKGIRSASVPDMSINKEEKENVSSTLNAPAPVRRKSLPPLPSAAIPVVGNTLVQSQKAPPPLPPMRRNVLSHQDLELIAPMEVKVATSKFPQIRNIDDLRSRSPPVSVSVSSRSIDNLPPHWKLALDEVRCQWESFSSTLFHLPHI
jgi:hypothetical protein